MFRNLYWSRVVSLQRYSQEQEKRWALEDDIKEMQENLRPEEGAEENEWEPVFDPTAFERKHQPLKLEDYRLGEEALLKWGAEATNIRKVLEARVREME